MNQLWIFLQTITIQNELERRNFHFRPLTTESKINLVPIYFIGRILPYQLGIKMTMKANYLYAANHG